MGRVIHFEISADDPQRAVNFYQNVYRPDFPRRPAPSYLPSTTSSPEPPRIDFSIMQCLKPGSDINTLDVPSIDDAIARIEMAGGKVLTGKLNLPRVGWFVYCQDNEGNPFSVMQFHPQALTLAQ